MLNGEVLYFVGLIIMAVALVVSVVAWLVFRKYKKRLEEEFSSEYGTRVD